MCLIDFASTRKYHLNRGYHTSSRSKFNSTPVTSVFPIITPQPTDPEGDESAREWFTISSRVLGRDLSLWDSFLRPLLFNRAKVTLCARVCVCVCVCVCVMAIKVLN